MASGPGVRNALDFLRAPDYTQGVVLAAATGQAFDVPAGMAFVAMAFNVDVWAKYGSTTARIPTSSTTAGSSSSELNPNVRNIGSTQACTGISLISASSGEGMLNWYKVA